MNCGCCCYWHIEGPHKCWFPFLSSSFWKDEWSSGMQLTVTTLFSELNITWLISRNRRIKRPPSGLESNLSFHFGNVWHWPPPAPESAQQGDLHHQEAAPLVFILEFGTHVPPLSQRCPPRTRPRVSWSPSSSIQPPKPAPSLPGSCRLVRASSGYVWPSVTAPVAPFTSLHTLPGESS